MKMNSASEKTVPMTTAVEPMSSARLYHDTFFISLSVAIRKSPTRGVFM
jgi:hypothetical protein